MNSYCYIFLLRKKLVSVFRYRNGQWEPIRRDGLDEFNVSNTEELIEWWKEEAAYSDSDGNVDLLFLSDEQENDWNWELVQQTFQFVKEKSVWSFNRLRDFFKQFNEMERVDLVVSSNNAAYPVKSTTGRPTPGGAFKFYTFPALEEEVDQSAPLTSKNETSSVVAQEPSRPASNAPSIGTGDGTVDILFRYFKSNLDNYDK